MPKELKLVGMKFNMLTVLKRSDKQIDGNIRWDCTCDCGGSTSVTGSRLKNGITKSCGCLALHNAVGNSSQFSHGMSRTPEYRAWIDAKSRCVDTEHRQREYYGGRGICVQDSWLNDFQAFFDYLGPRPSGLHSLDRIDNDLDYCEGNVRWATKLEQVANRGMNVNNGTGTTGVTLVVNPKNGFEHYRANWGPIEDMYCRSFSVNKYGRELALEFAVKARLNGLEKLKATSGYSEKHGEERQSK